MSGSRARAAAAAPGPDKKLPPGSAGPLSRLRGRRGSADAPPRQPWTESELLALETVRPEHVLGLCRVTESECGPVPGAAGALPAGLPGPGRAFDVGRDGARPGAAGGGRGGSGCARRQLPYNFQKVWGLLCCLWVLICLRLFVFLFFLWAADLCSSVPIASHSCSATWHLPCLCFSHP